MYKIKFRAGWGLTLPTAFPYPAAEEFDDTKEYARIEDAILLDWTHHALDVNYHYFHEDEENHRVWKNEEILRKQDEYMSAIYSCVNSIQNNEDLDGLKTVKNLIVNYIMHNPYDWSPEVLQVWNELLKMCEV